MLKNIIASTLCVMFVLNSNATEVGELPKYDIKTIRISEDWLVKRPKQSAKVYQDNEGKDLVLSNSLLSRTIRISPNAATVDFRHLTTGESILRGVKPEALVEIDGVSYPVGGLTGQPNYAFLRPEWIDQLQADPSSMQFVGFEVGEPKERMAWAQVRHHAPNVEWPPKGVHLRMDYQLPTTAGLMKGTNLLPSDSGRELIYKDDFKALNDSWELYTSSSHERSSFQNEGKIGEIYTPANTSVYAERRISPNTKLLECTFNVGTDTSQSWGPGIALVWGKRKTVKLNVRPGGNSYDSAAMFGLWDGKKEIRAAGGRQKLDLSKAVSMRFRIDGSTIHCEAKLGAAWQAIELVSIPEDWGRPKFFRVGKMDVRGESGDHQEKGNLVRLSISNVQLYSEIDLSKLSTTQPKPEDVTVSVHYELYDGIPVMSKWLTVKNNSNKKIILNRFTSEILAAVEYDSFVEVRDREIPSPNIHVETDYSFGGMATLNTTNKSVHWVSDPQYTSQVNYLRVTPCLLEVRPILGPNSPLNPGETFESFRAFLLPHDNDERERKSLAQRRMYRTIAPWVTENPLMMHARFSDWEAVKKAIDQSAEAGFEMVILTFGSGFNIEDESEAYLTKMTKYADYAKSKGVEIGGYSLLSSRNINEQTNVVSPEGERPTHGNAPCLESEWGHEYFRKLYQFYKTTGFSLLEHDGSYPGDACVAENHPGHKGHADSRWTQWRRISDFYKWCLANGVSLNVPDYYYLTGSTKCGMGYREVNWSLPRAEQVMHVRQNIFDGTWEKTPSMGWMFVPLTEYHGGGAAATIEPLDDHKDHYERMLYSNLGLGVQACYRGPRLFDTDATKAMLKSQVDWFKQYRDILESDLIHGKRADGRDIDWMLHVNPELKEKGMLLVFNPLNETVTRELEVNLYYTGLSDVAMIREGEGNSKQYTLSRDYKVQITMTIPAQGYSWFVIE